MKPAEIYVDDFSSGKDETELAAIVRRGFEAAGGPSQRVMAVIAAEARRNAGRQTFRMFRSMPRLAALAAVLAIAAGALYLNQNQAAPDSVKTIPDAGFSSQSTPDLAALLLDIQGLNEESFFMTEEAEPLWL